MSLGKRARWFVRARREGAFLDRPQVCVLVVVVRAESERDPRRINVDEKSLASGGSIFGRNLCAQNTGRDRLSDCLRRAGHDPYNISCLCYNEGHVQVRPRRSWAVPLTVIHTVPDRGLGARGVFKPCLSFMNSLSHSPVPDAPSLLLLSLLSQTSEESCFLYHGISQHP